MRCWQPERHPLERHLILSLTFTRSHSLSPTALRFGCFLVPCFIVFLCACGAVVVSCDVGCTGNCGVGNIQNVIPFNDTSFYHSQSLNYSLSLTVLLFCCDCLLFHCLFVCVWCCCTAAMWGARVTVVLATSRTSSPSTTHHSITHFVRLTTLQIKHKSKFVVLRICQVCVCLFVYLFFLFVVSVCVFSCLWLFGCVFIA